MNGSSSKVHRIVERLLRNLNKGGVLSSRVREKIFLNRFRAVYRDKVGIEIGGPTEFFNTKILFPVYREARQIDGVNYRNETVWGKHDPVIYRYGANGRTGRMFLAEGDNLTMISDHSYDFVLSAHNLEHYSNPLKAVHEWKRVIIADGGHIILLVPDKDNCFDRNRQVTLFEHLVNDYRDNVGPDDMTHFDEVISQTDLTIYNRALATTAQEFRELSRDNRNNRCMHHHVFDENVLRQTADYVGLDVIAVRKLLPYHLFCIYRKRPLSQQLSSCQTAQSWTHVDSC